MLSISMRFLGPPAHGRRQSRVPRRQEPTSALSSPICRAVPRRPAGPAIRWLVKIYDDYILRGESEQRMDELKNGLHMDRLSCHRFMANFFRLLLHVAAFNLLNAMRDDPQLPELLVAAQPCTWRTYADQSGGPNHADHAAGRRATGRPLALVGCLHRGAGPRFDVHSFRMTLYNSATAMGVRGRFAPTWPNRPP